MNERRGWWLSIIAGVALVAMAACGDSASGEGEEVDADDPNWSLYNDVSDPRSDLDEEISSPDSAGKELGDEPCTPGADCDDGDPCSFGDHCGTDGVCDGTMYACDDPYDCTVDVCLGDGECSNSLAADTCLIGDICYVAEQPKPGAYCWVCDPELSQEAWSEDDGAACSDLDPCTDNDVCFQGECAGQAMDCDDENVCTEDSCDADGGCVHVELTGACDDGDACTDGETCVAGECAGGVDICGEACASNDDCLAYEDADLCNGSLYCNAALNPAACVVNSDTIVSCPTDKDTVCIMSECLPETGFCVMVAVEDGLDCDDSNPCTNGDQCVGGLCLGTAVPDCGPTGTLLSEGFEGDFLPAGWTMTGTGWEQSPLEYSGDFSAQHVMSQADDRLITPPLVLTQATSVELSFWFEIWGAMQTTLYTLEVSTDGGASWSTPLFTGPEDANWQIVVVDLTPYCGSTVNLAWHYVATDLFTPPGKWFIDDILVIAE